MKSIPDRNVLFITLDQLNCHSPNWLPTPNWDRLAKKSVVFLRHYTGITPCSPARASLFTGLYGFNHGISLNGQPLVKGVPNMALEMRKLGYEPFLFGYTDIAKDPSDLHPNDPELGGYEKLLPGFRELTEMRYGENFEWLAYLNQKGYSLPAPPFSENMQELYRPVASSPGKKPEIRDPALYSKEDSDTAFLTDQFLSKMAVRRFDAPWFAHLTYFRPHPPLVAPDPYNKMFDLDSFPEAKNAGFEHPLFEFFEKTGFKEPPFISGTERIAKINRKQTQELRAVYLGLIAEVDFHLGRVFDWLEETGQAENTMIILTADHGEMLGDFGQWGKQTVFDGAFQIPLMIYDPQENEESRTSSQKIVTTQTQSIDIFPTILDRLGVDSKDIPKMNGRSLSSLMQGSEKSVRGYSISEMSFAGLRSKSPYQKKFGIDRREDAHAFILREGDYKYIQFEKALPPMLFNIQEDPEELHNLAEEPAKKNLGKEMAERLSELIQENRIQFSR